MTKYTILNRSNNFMEMVKEDGKMRKLSISDFNEKTFNEIKRNPDRIKDLVKVQDVYFFKEDNSIEYPNFLSKEKVQSVQEFKNFTWYYDEQLHSYLDNFLFIKEKYKIDEDVINFMKEKDKKSLLIKLINERERSTNDEVMIDTLEDCRNSLEWEA